MLGCSSCGSQGTCNGRLERLATKEVIKTSTLKVNSPKKRITYDVMLI